MIEIGKSKIKEYLLDGYVCNEKKVIKVEGEEYEIQKYQGEHQNEYLISEMKDGKVEGRCELFENGILRLSWMMKDGQRIGRISEYEKGKALFTEEWESVLGEGDHRMIENSKEGLKLVIRDRNNTMIYKGEFDEELNRHGKGLEYDENGKLKYEGYWNKGELMRIMREFKEDEMIEYEVYDHIEVLNRIPLYIGGYNMVNGEFKRNGIGYLLDRKNGTAIRECIYENGEELNGIDLFDGWHVNGMNKSIRYILNEECEIQIDNTEMNNSNNLDDMYLNMKDLITESNTYNELESLNLNEFEYLKSIVIGDDCFENVDLFFIDGLNELKYIKIGKNSFSHVKNDDIWDDNKSNNGNRSFRILNCVKLESIEIGSYSFSDYGGGFELINLPKLSFLIVGEIGFPSNNFCFSSFVIKGIVDDDIENE